MEKKATIFSLIFVGFIVLSAVGLIIFMGITAREYNYVQLEVNPRVEFIVDKKFKVVSYAPLNSDSRVILSGENFKGMDIDSACKKYLDICARTGYIDVDGVDNAVNLTVIDGLTQALDVHVAEAINDYFLDSEIMCAIIENNEDRSVYESKKKENLCCSNKYKLISTILEKDSTQDIESLKKLNEIELIDIVTNIHSAQHFTVEDSLKEKKAELLEKNINKYNSHMLKITNASKREFASLYNKFQNSSIKDYKNNFTEKYTKWQYNIV